MPLTVLSPYSGQPVKVRDQDVGRAVRDEENRVFYLVPRPADAAPAPADDPTGGTHYASLTRHGSDKDLARYDKLVERGVELDEHRHEAVPTKATRAVAHDATGKKRSPVPRLVALLLLLTAVTVGVKFGWEALADRDVLPAPPWSDVELPDLPGPDDLPGLPGEPVIPDLDPPEGAPDLTPGVKASPPPSPFGQPSTRTANALSSEKLEAYMASAMSQVVPHRSDEPGALPNSRLADSAFGFSETASGLSFRVDREGHGPRAQVRDYAVVNYAAYHAQSGLEVDATPPGEPLGFVLWAGQVFRGLDEGVAGMRVGERRTLRVPVHLTGVGEEAGVARSEAGWDQLDAALKVEVELVNVLPGVKKQVQRAGTGRFAGPGDAVKVHWAMYVGHGGGSGEAEPVIDSRRFGGPVSVTLGAGEVIAGLELGLVGMAEGEVAELRVPPYLAYGADGAAGGLIPPHATVRCEVELLAVEP